MLPTLKAAVHVSNVPAHWVDLIPVCYEAVCHKMSSGQPFVAGPPCLTAHAAMSVCISSYMIANQEQRVL